jgi:hypothetical protein
MKIHILEDKSFELNSLPEEIDDMRFAILDNSNPADADFMFIPLIFLESFTCPAVVLQIGEHKIKMPVEWQIVIGDDDAETLEALPLTSLNDRDFSAFQYNCRSSFLPTYEPIEIIDVYSEVNWYAPKLKNGQFLAVPLESGPKPKCVYFIKDVSRNCERIDYSELW